MNKDEEQKLVEQAKTDPQAFGRLYDMYYSKILNYASRRTGDLELSQDITTAVFMKALDHIGRFTWRGNPFSAWLYRIASNQIADHYRGKQSKVLSLDTLVDDYGFEPESEIDVETELIDAEEQIARHKQFLVVQQRLRKLPLKYQEVLSLRYFERKTIQEISDITGKRPGTIKSLLSRGVRRLREDSE